jgi:hypothetical protein
MGERVDLWDDQYPDDDAGNARNAAIVKGLVTQARALLAEQRQGFVSRHAGSIRKKELRREMSAPIAHLSHVARAAATEQHELGIAFRFKPSSDTYLSYRAAAGSMVDAAQSNRELLVKYGLAVPMLDSLAHQLEEFDAAVILSDEGRAKHVAATRELKRVATEIARTVKVMDGRNRQRFQNDGRVLGLWISASTVLGTPRSATEQEEQPPAGENPATPPSAGDVRPAA